MPDTSVTIEVHPYVEPGMNQEFADEFRAALHARRTEFDFKKTTFRIGYVGNDVKEVKTVLHGLNAPLPAVFTDYLTVSSVTLHSRVPRRVRAKTGWYDGARFGFPGAGCCVDPKGKHPNHLGRPQIYAVGDGYAKVIGLFEKVMAGRLNPGAPGSPWSGMKGFR